MEAPWAHITNLLEEIEILSGFSLEKSRRISIGSKEITLVTGDRIRFICLPGKFAGSESAGFWFDECELSEQSLLSFQTLNNRLRDRRALFQFGILTSSPKGLHGCSAFFQEKIAQKNKDYGVVVASTDDNPAHLGSGYSESLKDTMSKREIDENIHGKIVSAEGSIYQNEFCPQDSLAWAWRFRKNAPDRELHMAIDMGGNSWHMLLIEHDPVRDVSVVFGELAMDGVLDRTFFEACKNYSARKFGISGDDIKNVWIDANPKESRIISFKYWPGKVRFRIVKSHQEKISGINCVRWRLLDGQEKRRLLFAPSLRATKSPRRILQAMQNYKWREKRVDSFMVPTDFTDPHSVWGHAPDALRYYCWQKFQHLRMVDHTKAA